MGSDDAAYELVRQHNRYHRSDRSDDPTCPYCAFERSQQQQGSTPMYYEIGIS